MRARPAYAMPLLLLLLCLGVLSMHTLGHHPGPMTGQSLSGHSVGDMVAGDMASDTSRAVVVRPVGHAPMAPMGDPMSVCLAILSALTLAVALLVLRAHREGVTTLPRNLSVVGSAGRGPPPRVPVGLLLADLAVLRN